MSGEPTVFVIDDDRAMRDSLRFLIASLNLKVEDFGTAEEFLEVYDASRPGCILLDVRMPGLSGLDLLDILRGDRQSPPVLLITGHADVPMAVRALKSGAFDFIEKPLDDRVLLDRIRQALAANVERRSELERMTELEERFATLTTRERQVFGIVVAGKPNKVVASELDLSQKTIEVHRANVMKKMRADSFADLVKMAMQLGKTGAPRLHPARRDSDLHEARASI